MSHAEKIEFGYDATWKMRVPGDLIPRVQSQARRRGLTASSWIRSVILAELARAEAITVAAPAAE